MTRNMTLTGLLMLASVAAAVAAPELPADLAGCSTGAGLVPTVATMAPVQLAGTPRVVPVKAVAADVAQQPVHAPAACEVTEPYRLLHHGSMKLAPVCSGGAAV